MGDILGIGISHYPPLSGKDENMAGLLRERLKDPGVPPEMRTPSSWPPLMQAEWGDDEGVAAAAVHREKMLHGLRHCMQELRDFKPDFCIIWGDDQYENFKEDIIPPFCVLAYDDMSVQPWAQAQDSGAMRGKPNAWNEAADTRMDIRFARQQAKFLVSELIKAEFDIAYAYKPLNHPGIAHAFLNAVLYLDYDRQGFPFPIIPFPINCYGPYVISYKGFVSALGDRGRELDPPAPTPKRCFDLGAQVAKICKASQYRVALIASSSWSHAFLCDKTYRLMPDAEFDEQQYAAMVRGDYQQWRNTSAETIVETGNQETLNWMTLLGAMNELDMSCQWSDLVKTYLFNSTKVAAVFK